MLDSSLHIFIEYNCLTDSYVDEEEHSIEHRSNVYKESEFRIDRSMAMGPHIAIAIDMWVQVDGDGDRS